MRVAAVELAKDSRLKCVCPVELAIHEGDFCVVDCGSTLEYGRIARMRDEELTEHYAKEMPKVVRRATLQDQSRARENALYLKMATDTCCRKVKEHKLDMQIVSVQHSFDRKVVTIAYTSEERIQFRDLVKDLAADLSARIELRQIGVRDAAGVVGGMGLCGRELCCRSWLHEFEAVSVRMAKNQRLSLNPNTISGMCGRLKCCLRYENECYVEANQRLPRDGAIVMCAQGRGCVVDKNVLAEKLKLRMDDGRIQELAALQVTVTKDGERIVGEEDENG